MRGRNGSPWLNGTLKAWQDVLSGFQRVGLPFPLLDMSRRRLCWRDFHPREWQLNSARHLFKPNFVRSRSRLPRRGDEDKGAHRGKRRWERHGAEVIQMHHDTTRALAQYPNAMSTSCSSEPPASKDRMLATICATS